MWQLSKAQTRRIDYTLQAMTMARELKTGWVCIATSGSVVHGEEDGRVIDKEWLQQMAANYNTKVHTACLWPDHNRFFSFGKVLALKVEPATEPELKDELQLFAILAPNNSLIQANQGGQYCYPSIEVGENYRGTGTYFLKGLGVTDEPASAGVAELKFSKSKGKDETVLVFAGHQFNVNDSIESEKVSLIDRIFGKPPKEPPEPDTMTDTKKPEETNTEYSALLDALTSRFGAVMDDKLKDFAKTHNLEAKAPEADGNDNDDDKDKGKAPEQPEDKYAALKADFDKLQNQFAQLQNTPAGGTKVPEGEGDGAQQECL